MIYAMIIRKGILLYLSQINVTKYIEHTISVSHYEISLQFNFTSKTVLALHLTVMSKLASCYLSLLCNVKHFWSL